MSLGPWEVFILLVIMVLILGAWRLTNVGSAVGGPVRESRGAGRDQPAAPPQTPAPAVAPVVTVPQVTCPACQTANLATNKYCSACGVTLAAQPEATATEDALAATPPAAVPPSTCPSCATVNPPGQPFCGQCGAGLSQRPPEPPATGGGAVQQTDHPSPPSGGSGL
jgi:hypothetical protein